MGWGLWGKLKDGRGAQERSGGPRGSERLWRWRDVPGVTFPGTPGRWRGGTQRFWGGCYSQGRIVGGVPGAAIPRSGRSPPQHPPLAEQPDGSAEGAQHGGAGPGQADVVHFLVVGRVGGGGGEAAAPGLAQPSLAAAVLPGLHSPLLPAEALQSLLPLQRHAGPQTPLSAAVPTLSLAAAVTP